MKLPPSHFFRVKWQTFFYNWLILKEKWRKNRTQIQPIVYD